MSSVPPFSKFLDPPLVVASANAEELRLVRQSVQAARQILSSIDKQVDEHEKQQRLRDIYNRLDPRSFLLLSGIAFTVSFDFSAHNALYLHCFRK